MIENITYYTFSTIPQVLAGVIALLGVFWVYRISSLNNQLRSMSEAFIREVDINDKFKKSFVLKLQSCLEKKEWTIHKIYRLPYRISSSKEQEDWKWIYTTLVEIYDCAKENDIIRHIKSQFEKIDNDKRRLTKRTKTALILAGLHIVISILLIIVLTPLVSYLSYFWLVIIFGANLGFLGYQLYYVIKTVISSLKITTINYS